MVRRRSAASRPTCRRPASTRRTSTRFWSAISTATTSPVSAPKRVLRTSRTPRSWCRRRSGSSGTTPATRRKVIDPFKPGFANVKRVFDPIAKDVKQFEYGKELVPGITAVDARGHSPGHTAFLVASGNGKLLVTSDTVNHQILIRNPEWSLWADMDAAMAMHGAQAAARHGGSRQDPDRRLSPAVPVDRLHLQARRRLRIPSGLLAAGAVSARQTRRSERPPSRWPFRFANLR